MKYHLVCLCISSGQRVNGSVVMRGRLRGVSKPTILS
jgi:hypothetical protein